MVARTLKQVNKSIKNNIGDFVLCKGMGYFFVSSDNNEISLQLSELYTTSIYVCHLNHQTVEEWLEDVKKIVNNLNND